MKKINLNYLIKNYEIALVLVVIVVVLTILRPNFIRPANLIEIMRQVSFTGIVAVGMTFCFLTGGIDLSVGSNVGLAVAVCALIMSGRTYSTGGHRRRQYQPDPWNCTRHSCQYGCRCAKRGIDQ